MKHESMKKSTLSKKRVINLALAAVLAWAMPTLGVAGSLKCHPPDFRPKPEYSKVDTPKPLESDPLKNSREQEPTLPCKTIPHSWVSILNFLRQIYQLSGAICKLWLKLKSLKIYLHVKTKSRNINIKVSIHYNKRQDGIQMFTITIILTLA
jgi:hypothetical protein